MVKIKLHDECEGLDSESFMSNDLWDTLLSSDAIDRDDATKTIQQSLMDSETSEMRHKREFMLKVYNKEIGFKEHTP